MKFLIHIFFLSDLFCQVYEFEINSIPNMETPLSINADGTKIVGTNFDGQAVYWSDSTGTQVVGVGKLWGISDNNRIFGELENNVGNWEAALIENGEATFLGNIENGNACDAFYSHGLSISADGLTGVGMGWRDCETSAFYWTDEGGIIELGQYNGESTKAQAVSGNGQLIGGWAQTSNRATCLWDQHGTINLIGSLQENSDYGEVHAINNDGTQVVGYCSGSGGNQTEGFIWTEQGGMVGLGVPSNSASTNRSLAMDISENNVVVGQYLNTTPIFYKACIYTEETGEFVDLHQYLLGLGMDEINGWDLQRALCVSNDGNTIVGYGKDPQNNWTGWIVKISVPLINDHQIMEDESSLIDLSYIGETMSYDAQSDTSAVSVLIEGQTLLLSPLPNWHGIATITVYMTDENNLLDTASFLLTVSSVNDPPIIAPLDDISISEDGTASIFLNVTDIDNVDLMYNFYTNQPIFNFSVVGDTLFISPFLDWNGQANLTVFVSDGEDSDNTSFDITVTPVNDAPTIEEIDDVTIDEDGSIDIVLNSGDVDGDDLTYSFILLNYDVSLAILENTLTITATPDFNGDVPITMLVSDSVLIDSASFIVTINAVNDSPEEFELISPTVLDTFQISTTTDETIPFTWEPSFDADSEVTYKLTVTLDYFGNVYTNEYENITDTTTGISTYEYAVFMTDNVLSLWNIDYVVEVSDEEFTVISEAGEFILVNASLSIDSEILPEVFALHQNYPNPFNPITSLRYDLPADGLVNITIYDMMGRIVKTLVNGSQTAGYKSIQWNATNDRNEPVSAGLYLYTIQTGEFRQTKKMVLLK